MSENLAEQLRRLPDLLGAHVALAAGALLTGVLLSLPVGLLSARSAAARGLVLGAAAIVQTIPSLALLALMVPLLGLFGFWPAFVALVLYTAFPVLKGTVVGVLQVPASVLEAADALGMTPRRRLWSVELPLALPVIVAGVRTAAVWGISLTTLSTPVGQPSLGNYIFAGLQTRNWISVLVGCMAASILALLVDGGLGLLEKQLLRRRPDLRRLGATIAVGAVVLLALTTRWALPFEGEGFSPEAPASASKGNTDPVASAPHSSAEESPAFVGVLPPPAQSALSTGRVHGPLRVGAKTFTEQYILSQLIRLRLVRAGMVAQIVGGLGSTVVFDALVNGDIDLYVDYTGTLWANGMKRRDTAPAWSVRAETAAWLSRKYGIRQLGVLGFENSYALALPRAVATRLGVNSIEALGPHAAKMRLGSDYEFFDRPEWKSLRETYSLSFHRKRSLDSTFMYAAVAQGEVDVITAFSSDGRIAALDLLVLEDPRGAFPPYEAVLLLGPRVASEPDLVSALEPLIGGLPVELMRRANLRVDREDNKQTPTQSARWLDQQLPP